MWQACRTTDTRDASRFYCPWYILSIKICVLVYLLLRLKGFLSKVPKVAKFKGRMQKSLKSCLPTTLYFSWRTHIASTILPSNQRCYVSGTHFRVCHCSILFAFSFAWPFLIWKAVVGQQKARKSGMVMRFILRLFMLAWNLM